MATRFLGSFANGSITFEYDYSDANLRIQRIRCINNSGLNGRATVIDPTTQAVVAQTVFLPGTTVVNISGLKITADEEGNAVFPYEARFDFPVP